MLKIKADYTDCKNKTFRLPVEIIASWRRKG
jgi:hypothetical protein